ncbi:hypothetical protein M422DRAFT_265436 [Sphaerobolus stellatus SS14]|uniref:Uncharacterized protein n=1 Tax=Sphaerobolus stellatus (strain SS14) TaxID=990650 RepID=A0A0C9UTV2_SPHS4|nr:hypothetical protein M422DRAFT_265436 [Sphaerobolus stellatus SS14]
MVLPNSHGAIVLEYLSTPNMSIIARSLSVQALHLIILRGQCLNRLDIFGDRDFSTLAHLIISNSGFFAARTVSDAITRLHSFGVESLNMLPFLTHLAIPLKISRHHHAFEVERTKPILAFSHNIGPSLRLIVDEVLDRLALFVEDTRYVVMPRIPFSARTFVANSDPLNASHIAVAGAPWEHHRFGPKLQIWGNAVPGQDGTGQDKNNRHNGTGKDRTVEDDITD